TSVTEYKDAGYLPEALLNYLLRLGWSYKDQEVFSRQQMIELFDLTQVNKAAAAFNPDKLKWLNQQYLINSEPQRLAGLLAFQFQQLDVDITTGPKLLDVVQAQQGRAHTLRELAEISSFFYQEFTQYEAKAAIKHLNAKTYPLLETALSALTALTTWSPETIHQAVEQVATQTGVKLGKVAQPLRVAVVGRAASPGIDITLSLVGKKICLQRIERALKYITQTNLAS
ncbi:glutamyl-tRNA synthetase, partial [Achromatium sp. WMS1]